MNSFIRALTSVTLLLSMLCALTLPAVASEALGEDMAAESVLLNRQTQLSSNVFWSTTYSDLRTEHFITYTPNAAVTPIVTYGNALTDRSSVAAMAAALEAQGHRVVAGVNGDFYNVSTGLPVGIVVTEGILRSSDAGSYAVGFLPDGSAVLGKPALTVTADLGYSADDGLGNLTEFNRTVTAVNKARVGTGGIYLYTYDFNDRHSTGTTETGVNVLCTVESGSLAIGSTVTARVEQVTETASATVMRENQFVLTASLQSDAYHTGALRNIPVDAEITIAVTAADSRWNEVDYAVGALYLLAENGAVVPGLAAGANPRTVVGQKGDGTLIFYTIDGRKSGHSIGASLSQAAARLIELGCQTAVCLDGGGSTNLAVTEPDALTAEIINTPSETGRAVTNQIFLVASNAPTGRLSHFYVTAEADYVLSGSQVSLTASAVDTNFIPMTSAYSLTASAGSLTGGVLTTPAIGGDVTVTASAGGKTGSTVVHTIASPDSIGVKHGSTAVTSLTLTPGAAASLTGTAVWNHMALKADADCFTWSFTGDCGTVDAATGVFTASAPGSGTLTASAGGKSVSIPVTVASVPLRTVESFEGVSTIFDGGSDGGIRFSRTAATEGVRLGRAAGQLDYTLTAERGFAAEWRTQTAAALDGKTYGALSLWVNGDGSGNSLELLYSNGETAYLTTEIAKLDFTGWKQVSVPTAGTSFAIQGLRVSAAATYVDDGLGGVMPVYESAVHSGTVYVDQLVSTFPGVTDTAVPTVTLTLDTASWTVTAAVSDGVDGILPASAVTVSCNGVSASPEGYNASTGSFVYGLPGSAESAEAMRITVTAKDASGNIGRGSLDIPSLTAEHHFTDIDDYWGATFVDFLYNTGVTTGYDDGSFRPNQTISRAQFAVMLYRYLGLNEAEYADVTLPFADLDQIGAYALPAIRALYARGILNGSAGQDGLVYLRPNSSLTRAQAAAMIGRTQEKGYAAAEPAFTDSASIPAYAVDCIRTMTAQGIISGYADGSFRPGSSITRGQMAKILYNLM